MAVVAIAVLTAAPLLAGAGSGLTTADLAHQLARAAGINLPASASPQAALEALHKTGIRLGSDLKAPVTEKVLVEVALALGVKVSSSQPEAAVTPAASLAFVQLLRGELQSAAAAAGSGKGASDTVPISCQGRESRDDREGTPASQSDPNATEGPCEGPTSGRK